MTAIDKKLDRIISILERIEAKLYKEPMPSPAIVVRKNKPAKKIPMAKDPFLISEIAGKFMKNQNRKIYKAINKGEQGLPLTNSEQIIYQEHLEKQKGDK